MEINPSLARLRILEAVDSVALQRRATPDGDQAGCPGCPYFWTCPVPHRGRTVEADEEIEVPAAARGEVAADGVDTLPRRPAFRPRDERDIGWSDMPDGRAPDDWADDADDSDNGADDFGDDADDDVDASAAPARRRWWRR